MTAVARLDRTEVLVNGEFPFTRTDFQTVARLLHGMAGITLQDSKATLVYSRLAKRLRVLGLESFSDYCDLVGSDAGADERQSMLAALTTNVTRFFREPHHFEHLRSRVIEPLADAVRAGRRLRIWSAGCSTGEEPYSIAMSVCEVLGDAPRADVRILATDLDSDVLSRARAGRYSAETLKSIDPTRRGRFFQEVEENGTTRYSVRPMLSRLITFNQLNLMHDLPMRGPLDVIFCRNVVIYFDKETQRRLFQRYARLQRPGDLLFIGHSESMFKVSEAYTLIGRTIYSRNEASP